MRIINIIYVCHKLGLNREFKCKDREKKIKSLKNKCGDIKHFSLYLVSFSFLSTIIS